MHRITTPPVDYTATALRPTWTDLPVTVRDLVTERLGYPVSAGPPAGGGFSGGYAAVVRGSRDTQFVKAVSISDNAVIADGYRREVELNGALPSAVPAPRVRWSAEVDGWVVLGLGAVDGARMPGHPWDAAELATVLAGWNRAAAALAADGGPLRKLGLSTLAELDKFDEWRRLAAGDPSAFPPPAWLPAALVGTLADLEGDWEAAAAGDAIIHCDLRKDNVLLDAAGEAWFVDWNWPCLAAAWVDLVPFLTTAYGDGHDTSALFFAHPLAAGVTDTQLDALLAAVSGMWLGAGSQADVPHSPWMRQHQRWSGETCLRWLAERKGWNLS